MIFIIITIPPTLLYMFFFLFFVFILMWLHFYHYHNKHEPCYILIFVARSYICLSFLYVNVHGIYILWLFYFFFEIIFLKMAFLVVVFFFCFVWRYVWYDDITPLVYKFEHYTTKTGLYLYNVKVYYNYGFNYTFSKSRKCLKI